MRFLEGTESRRRIYLMRHGHVDYVRKFHDPEEVRNVPLTERGHEEAHAVGQSLADIKIDHAVSSGLARSRDTADIVLSYQKSVTRLEHVHDARFAELQSDGSGSSNRASVPRKLIIDIMTNLFARAAEEGARIPPKGELFSDAFERVTSGAIELLSQPGWSTMLLVAHEGVNRVLLSWAASGGLQAVGAFEQDTCCVNIIDFDLDISADPGSPHFVKRAAIKSTNLTPHNPTKRGMHLNSLEDIMSGMDD